MWRCRGDINLVVADEGRQAEKFSRIMDKAKKEFIAIVCRDWKSNAIVARIEAELAANAPQMSFDGEEGETRSTSMLDATRSMLEEGGFSGRAKNSLAHLSEQIVRWRSLFDTMPIAEAAEAVLRESGYIGMWQQEKTPEAQGRVENLKELLRALEEFENFTEFLEHVSLVSDTSDKSDDH